MSTVMNIKRILPRTIATILNKSFPRNAKLLADHGFITNGCWIVDLREHKDRPKFSSYLKCKDDDVRVDHIASTCVSYMSTFDGQAATLAETDRQASSSVARLGAPVVKVEGTSRYACASTVRWIERLYPDCRWLLLEGKVLKYGSGEKSVAVLATIGEDDLTR